MTTLVPLSILDQLAARKASKRSHLQNEYLRMTAAQDAYDGSCYLPPEARHRLYKPGNEGARGAKVRIGGAMLTSQQPNRLRNAHNVVASQVYQVAAYNAANAVAPSNADAVTQRDASMASMDGDTAAAVGSIRQQLVDMTSQLGVAPPPVLVQKGKTLLSLLTDGGISIPYVQAQDLLTHLNGAIQGYQAQPRANQEVLSILMILRTKLKAFVTERSTSSNPTKAMQLDMAAPLAATPDATVASRGQARPVGAQLAPQPEAYVPPQPRVRPPDAADFRAEPVQANNLIDASAPPPQRRVNPADNVLLDAPLAEVNGNPRNLGPAQYIAQPAEIVQQAPVDPEFMGIQVQEEADTAAAMANNSNTYGVGLAALASRFAQRAQDIAAAVGSSLDAMGRMQGFVATYTPEETGLHPTLLQHLERQAQGDAEMLHQGIVHHMLRKLPADVVEQIRAEATGNPELFYQKAVEATQNNKQRAKKAKPPRTPPKPYTGAVQPALLRFNPYFDNAAMNEELAQLADVAEGEYASYPTKSEMKGAYRRAVTKREAARDPLDRLRPPTAKAAKARKPRYNADGPLDPELQRFSTPLDEDRHAKKKARRTGDAYEQLAGTEEEQELQEQGNRNGIPQNRDAVQTAREARGRRRSIAKDPGLMDMMQRVHRSARPGSTLSSTERYRFGQKSAEQRIAAAARTAELEKQLKEASKTARPGSTLSSTERYRFGQKSAEQRIAAAARTAELEKQLEEAYTSKNRGKRQGSGISGQKRKFFETLERTLA